MQTVPKFASQGSKVNSCIRNKGRIEMRMNSKSCAVEEREQRFTYKVTKFMSNNHKKVER